MTTTTRRRADRGRSRAALTRRRPGGFRGAVLGSVLAGLPVCANALTLDLPATAQETERVTEAPGRLRLPLGPWQRDGGMPARVLEGVRETAAYRVPATTATPFQLMLPLRAQILAAGYDILFECEASECGGFDFRFALEVLPAPAMQVRLTDFHFVSARVPGTGAAVSLLTSRDGGAGYIQIARVGGEGPVAAPDPPADRRPVLPGPGSRAEPDIAGRLETLGHVALGDVAFPPGASALGSGAIASLDALAAWLQAEPARRIVLVGHTDATGSLAANRALSLRRAEAVARYLVDRHGIPRAQLGAEGIGYLAPVASNLTVEGREANRRVEAVRLP